MFKHNDTTYFTKSMSLVGQQKHSLTVVNEAEKDNVLKRRVWNCLCKCGKNIKVFTGDWNAGRVKTCGCSKFRRGVNNPNFIHGLTKTNEYSYKYRIKKRYGITIDEYDAMYKEQDGKCAICSKDPLKHGEYRLSVDHCHETKKVRGLLCSKCNHGIGLLKENITIFNNAIAYLLKNGVANVSTQ